MALIRKEHRRPDFIGRQTLIQLQKIFRQPDFAATGGVYRIVFQTLYKIRNGHCIHNLPFNHGVNNQS